ncbi:dTDP-4-dehydrorhamnose reductase [Shewanella sp. OMA3-2]|uniref:dTDP-4-dehydrorhamnose reductase n=1 Tax=Shewanella sp. OMA3-2 TaxID=2908650 RepID=UPI001F1FB121|nr:dTDP-4-dehydrorhamnose reductase [Shewanella sp. OMA3-2]UJF23149.1 dTDP-4-dehydrorhamnose reductase [Shewanella sp. OMA3-2]
MRLLITGANGQLGRSLVAYLHCVMMPHVEVLALTKQQLDISNFDAVEQVIAQYQPDYIINTAAYTAVDKAEDDIELAFAINCDGAANVAKAANNIGATIFYISTDYVFAGDKQGDYQENDITAPLSVYGESKLAGEVAVMQTNPKHIILRTAWMFSEYGNNFVRTILRLSQPNPTLAIVDDQFGGPTYAGHVAQTLISIMLQLANNTALGKDAENVNNDQDNPINDALYGVYHFAGLPHVSWYQLAQQILQQKSLNHHKRAENHRIATELNLAKLKPIPTEQYPVAAKRPKNSKLACQKIIDTFGIQSSDWMSALSKVVTILAPLGLEDDASQIRFIPPIKSEKEQ